MLVKLHDYNNNGKIDRMDAYKAPNGFYYSSEEAYCKTKEIEETRKKCIERMFDFMEYKSYMKMPTLFYKKLKEWEPYGYNVIYLAMSLAENGIEQAVKTKTFHDESGKVSYLSAIIQNRLNDAFKIEERNRKAAADKPKIEVDDVMDIGQKSRSTTSVADLLGGL